MNERRYVAFTGALAALGAGIAGYLTYLHYTDGRIACPTSGCETVQSSSFAEMLGVPVALLGLVAYLAILAALAWPREAGRWLALSAAIAGTLFSAYLIVVQAYEIGAFCLWCLVSDAVVTAIAALAFLRVRAADRHAGAAR